jgi:hypothetical protein
LISGEIESMGESSSDIVDYMDGDVAIDEIKLREDD